MDLFFWIFVAVAVFSWLAERGVRRRGDPDTDRPRPTQTHRPVDSRPRRTPPPVLGRRPTMYFPPEQEEEMRRAADLAGPEREGEWEPVAEWEGRTGDEGGAAGEGGAADPRSGAPAPAEPPPAEKPVPAASPALFRSADDVVRGVVLAEVLGPPRSRRPSRGVSPGTWMRA